jgi:hypothetical protein
MSLRFARDIVPAPGRCTKCADARRWNADTAVNITGGGGGARIGVQYEVPRGYMALASHRGVASMAVAISVADRSLSLVIQFLHWI